MTNEMLEQVKQAIAKLQDQAWEQGHPQAAIAYGYSLSIIREAEDREASSNYAQWLVGR